eukprot:scaffold259488_cov43-Prasinocladus_malaysianus.AAC.1
MYPETKANGMPDGEQLAIPVPNTYQCLVAELSRPGAIYNSQEFRAAESFRSKRMSYQALVEGKSKSELHFGRFLALGANVRLTSSSVTAQHLPDAADPEAHLALEVKPSFVAHRQLRSSAQCRWIQGFKTTARTRTNLGTRTRSLVTSHDTLSPRRRIRYVCASEDPRRSNSEAKEATSWLVRCGCGRLKHVRVFVP